MKLALREDMSRGGILAEQLDWLEGLGFEGIELSAAALDYRRESSRRSSPTRRFRLRTSPAAEPCSIPTPPNGLRRRT
jgi:hypothetical protein